MRISITITLALCLFAIGVSTSSHALPSAIYSTTTCRDWLVDKNKRVEVRPNLMKLVQGLQMTCDVYRVEKARSGQYGDSEPGAKLSVAKTNYQNLQSAKRVYDSIVAKSGEIHVAGDSMANFSLRYLGQAKIEKQNLLALGITKDIDATEPVDVFTSEDETNVVTFIVYTEKSKNMRLKAAYAIFGNPGERRAFAVPLMFDGTGEGFYSDRTVDEVLSMGRRQPKMIVYSFSNGFGLAEPGRKDARIGFQFAVALNQRHTNVRLENARLATTPQAQIIWPTR